MSPEIPSVTRSQFFKTGKEMFRRNGYPEPNWRGLTDEFVINGIWPARLDIMRLETNTDSDDDFLISSPESERQHPELVNSESGLVGFEIVIRADYDDRMTFKDTVGGWPSSDDLTKHFTYAAYPVTAKEWRGENFTVSIGHEIACMIPKAMIDEEARLAPAAPETEPEDEDEPEPVPRYADPRWTPASTLPAPTPEMNREEDQADGSEHESVYGKPPLAEFSDAMDAMAVAMADGSKVWAGPSDERLRGLSPPPQPNPSGAADQLQEAESPR